MADDALNLDRMLARLDEAVRRRSSHGDAIDDILNSSPRRTKVHSLADDESVKQFRRELVDGFIRVDTANRLLGLIEQVVSGL